MKTVFLCTPRKLGKLNHELIKRMETAGFDVLCAVTHTPQNIDSEQIFEMNIKLIKKSDMFVAVLKDYGKDLAAEVGMAYAWNKPIIGINFNAEQNDIMIYHVFDKMINPDQLEATLSSYEQPSVTASL
ncbi:MAG: nucleoside 2-deoxyribosyltransferase [Candidatus Aenigmarchaeota archaeon]|nr:nucleoside 2-deoxyribosyltransferase [Candidatus Aenigmarchaeota archaeon]